MKSFPIRFLLAGLVLPTLANVLSAAEEDWSDKVYRGKPGSVVGPLPACAIDYSLSWNGKLKAGEVSIQIAPDPKRPHLLIGEAKGKSTGLARALWRYDHHFVSTIDGKSLRPVLFQSEEEEKKDRTSTTAIFRGSKVTSKKTVVIKATEEKKVRDREFEFEPMVDLLSSILLLRSLPLVEGEEINLLVHPFDSPYLGTFKVLGREKHKTPDGKKQCIKLSVNVGKVDRNDLTVESYKKLVKATIWVADDEFRMPVEIRSDIFIGDVRVVMKKKRFLKKGEEATKGRKAPRGPVSRKQRGKKPSLFRHFRRR